MPPGPPGMASGSERPSGRAGLLRGPGARSLGRKVELWSLGELTSMGAGKLAVVTVASGCVAKGSWDPTQVVGDSCGGRGSKSLSQTPDRVCLRLARASWLPWDVRAGSWPLLPELGAAVVVMMSREASSPIDKGLQRGLVNSARTGSPLSSREMLCDFSAQELAAASM